ncbi:hypothetical protein [uncultured Desulfovibrio sp.]|uniref:hypothetical protein n=1 Tax=uncultured Desulfovibrio sp. TaxID=167968 RepID=UPI002615E159|nr:hypothetical protein [uncultured Desulfovibrio sp.]
MAHPAMREEKRQQPGGFLSGIPAVAAFALLELVWKKYFFQMVTFCHKNKRKPLVFFFTNRPGAEKASGGRLPPEARIMRVMSRQARFVSRLELFPFETFCVSNPTAWRYAEKRGFSAHVQPGGAVPPPRVSPFSKVKRSRSFPAHTGGCRGRSPRHS